MSQELKLTGYFAGALFSGQELFGNQVLAAEINDVAQGVIQLDLPQDLSAQETGSSSGTRSADYLGMIQRDFVFANMNGPELDSGTVAEYVVASMLGMPRVQFRSDFRNVGDVRSEFPAPLAVCKTDIVPYNLMLGHDESVLVYAHAMALYKETGGMKDFVRSLAIAAVRGIRLAFEETQTAKPTEYASQRKALVRDLKLDAAAVGKILASKRQRHLSKEYRRARRKLMALDLG
jgi:nucleoside 2-deoxyribosyltransferase